MLNIVKFVILSIIYLDISLVIANDEIEELDVKIENNKHLSKKYTNQITNYNLKIKKSDEIIAKLDRDLSKIKNNKIKIIKQKNKIEKNISKVLNAKKINQKDLNLLFKSNLIKSEKYLFENFLDSKTGSIFFDNQLYSFITNSKINEIYFYKRKKNILETENSALLEKKKLLVALENKISKTMSAIHLEEKNLKRKIADIKKVISILDIEKQNFLSNKKKLENIFSNNSDKNSEFYKAMGLLDYPAKGIISKKYGDYKDAIKSKWTGYLFTTKSNEKVYAIFSGTVVFADYLKGYGYIAIIDHGDDYMTLYANNKRLLVENGDIVNTGQNISISGKSGGRSVNGVYFELRKKGNPINPKKWFKG